MNNRICIFLFFILFSWVNSFSQSDNCATATVLSLNAAGNVCVTGSTVNATSSNTGYANCNPLPNVNNEVWYTYVSNGANNVFDVIPQGLTNPEIVIYTGGCGATLETCNTIVGTGTLTTGWGIPAGTQVWIGVMSNQGNEGGFDFCVTSTAPQAGGGNGCAGAIPLCDQAALTSVDMTQITPSGVTPDCFGSSVQADVWFTFTCTQTGTLEFMATPTGPGANGVELDWAIWNTTANGCNSIGGPTLACNYNYDFGSGNPSGMGPTSCVACPTNGVGGACGEFCSPIVITAGQTYTIVMDYYTGGGVGFMDFAFLPGMTAEIAPDADFTISPTGVTCASSVTVSINDNSLGVPTYDFGDGTTYTGNNPPDHSYTSPGTYAITATIAGPCPSSHTEFVQLFGPLSLVPISNDETCPGACDGSASIQPSGGSGIYTYSWNPGNQSTSSISNLCQGNISVTVNDAICNSSITENIVINSGSSGSVSAGSNQIVCNDGTAVTLTGSGAVSYTWDNGVVNGVPFIPSIGTTSFTVTGTDANGCTITDQVDVTVNALPVVGAGTDQVVCNDGTMVTLFGTGAVTYSWDNGITDGAPFLPPLGTTTYIVTGFDVNNCTNTDQVDVTVNALPTVLAGTDQTVCDDGTMVTLNGAGAVNYSWDNGITDGIPFLPSLGTTTYTVTGTDLDNCTNTDQVDVTVISMPSITPFQTILTCGQYSLPSISGSNLSGNQQYYSASNGTGTIYQPGDIISSDIILYAYDNFLTCSDEEPITITINSSSISLGNDTTICLGSSITLDPGSGFTSYLWSDNSTNQTLNVSSSGTYSVDVTNYGLNMVSNGDFELGSQNFNTSYIPGTGGAWGLLSNPGTYAVTTSPSLVHNNFSPCTDHTTGTGNMLVVNGSSIANQDVWCQTFNVTPNTDFEFSTWLMNFDATNPAELSFYINGVQIGANFNPVNAGCIWENFFETWNSGANTSATICIVNQSTASGGNDFALDDISFTPLCVYTDDIVVTVQQLPIVSAGNDILVCDDGSLVTLIGAGTTTYSWDNGVLNNTPFTPALGTTTYTLTGTDLLGCVNTDQVDVVVNPLPLIDAGFDQIVCDGFSVLVSGSGGLNYTWNNSVLDNVLFTPPLGTTTYTVTATDANGCENTDNLIITVNPLPIIDMSLDTSICIGNNVELFADTNGLLVEQFTMTFDAAFSYSTLNTSLPGNYYAVVSGTFSGAGPCEERDGGFWFYQGCNNINPIPAYPWQWNGTNPNTQSQVPTVYNPNHIYNFYFNGGSSQTFSFQEQNASWYGDNSGSLTFQVFYLGNVQWSNGATTSTTTVSPSQTTTYTVSIDYGSGCLATDSVVVSVSDPSYVENIVQSTCGNSNGEISLVASNGIAPYQFSIDNGINFQSSGLFTALMANSYDVLIVDYIGCQVAGQINLTDQSGPVINSINATDVSCQGLCDGIISINASGATMYSIDNGINFQNQNIFTSLCDGIYDVLVEDNNGCQATAQVVINEPQGLTANITKVDLNCYQECIGQINVVSQGGTGLNEYSIDNGVNFQVSGDFLNLCAGNYNVVVQDLNNCQTTPQPILVSEPPQLILTLGVTDETCAGACDGVINSIPSGGTGPGTYNYNWVPSQPTPNLPIALNLCSGNYSLTVSDGNGCEITTDTVVVGPQSIVIDNVIVVDELCPGDCSGSLTIFAPNATLFSMDGINYQPTNSFTGLCAGIYTLYAKDAVGCEVTIVDTLNSPDPVALQATGTTTICIGASAQLDATCTGGSGGYTYSWDNGINTQSITVSPSTTQSYCVIAIDQNNCPSTNVCVTVTVNPPLNVQAQSDQTICMDDYASISALANGGDGGPYTYTWNQGVGLGQNQNVNPTATTTYVVTVTDGCQTPSVSDSVAITVIPIPVISFSGDNLEGCTPLEVTFTDTGLPAGSQCNWDFGDGNTSNDCGPVSHTFTTPGCWDVGLSITTTEGCLASVDLAQYICVFDYPNASFTYGPQPTTIMDSEIHFTNNSTGATNYLWSFDTQGSTATSSQENPSYTFDGTQEGIYEVCLDATSIEGCLSTSCKVVEINDVFLVFVPNAFTPGGDDNINDIFLPVVNGVEVQEFEFYVFNRWGELIFESHHINDGWDGRFKGEIVQQDAYVWKLQVVDQLTNSIHQYTGHVLLLGNQQ